MCCTETGGGSKINKSGLQVQIHMGLRASQKLPKELNLGLRPVSSPRSDLSSDLNMNLEIE